MVLEPTSAGNGDRLRRLQERLTALDEERASLAAEIESLRAAEELARRVRRTRDNFEGRGEGRRACRPPIAGDLQDRPFQAALPRSRRRIPASLGEFEDGAQRLFSGLRQRVAARHLRKAASEMLRLRASSLHCGGRLDDRAPSPWNGAGRLAIRHGRLSVASGQHLLVSCRRLRRRRMAQGRLGLRRRVSSKSGPCRHRAIPLRQWRTRLDLLRGSRARGFRKASRRFPDFADDGAPAGYRLQIL